jgi:hypothetical protein
MKFSIFPTIKTRTPQIVDFDINTINLGLTTPVQTTNQKDKLPLWSPTIFKQNRSGANALYLTMLVYDIDDGTSLDSWRCFADHHVIVHTSFSHKPNYNKFRIIIPLKTPINAKDWNRAHIAAIDHWNKRVGVGSPDMKAIKDVARIYYRYSIPTNNQSKDSPLSPSNYHYSTYWNGELFDLKYDYVEIEKKEYKKIKYERNKSLDLADVMLDTNFRYQCANRLNANIVGNSAKHIPCPSCNRNSVVFSLDISVPNSIKWPKCNHIGAGKCNWYGGFEMLMGGVL